LDCWHRFGFGDNSYFSVRRFGFIGIKSSSEYWDLYFIGILVNTFWSIIRPFWILITLGSIGSIHLDILVTNLDSYTHLVLHILGHLYTYIHIQLGLIVDAVEFWINLDLSDTAFEHFVWGYLHIWIYLHRLIESHLELKWKET